MHALLKKTHHGRFRGQEQIEEENGTHSSKDSLKKGGGSDQKQEGNYTGTVRFRE